MFYAQTRWNQETKENTPAAVLIIGQIIHVCQSVEAITMHANAYLHVNGLACLCLPELDRTSRSKTHQPVLISSWSIGLNRITCREVHKYM